VELSVHVEQHVTMDTGQLLIWKVPIWAYIH